MTVALVGFTSWTAVSWKLSQSPMAGPRMAEVLLAAVSTHLSHAPSIRHPFALLDSLRGMAATAAAHAHVLSPSAHHPPGHHLQTAALACLWPIPLGLVSRSAYPRWREWLVPVHHAVQHWIGVHFALPQKAPPLLVSPLPGGAHMCAAAEPSLCSLSTPYSRGRVCRRRRRGHGACCPSSWPRFASLGCTWCVDVVNVGRAAQVEHAQLLPFYCTAEPHVLQAFGACLQRTRLRTFLWSQPLLLAPVFFVGRTHCANHLTATPEAAKHLQHIAVAMQRCSSWLPVAPVLAEAPMLATAAGSSLSSAEGACLGVHFWLVVILAYGLPAIVIHRLEGQEEHTRLQARKQQQQRGHQSAAADNATAERDLLLQRRPTAIHSAAELFLAGYAAWLLAQLALPLFH